MTRLAAVCCLAMLSGLVSAETPPELGHVAWGHDLDAAMRASADSGRPIFLLFQEIPGCETCQTFGQGPLSHPLMVEAIEDLFVPVVVYNNRKGNDAELLRRFKEPAWNNPVVRFLNAEGRDWIERREGIWSTGDLVQRMIAVLESADRDVPRYLRLVAEEASTPHLEIAEFAMHCFWEGEAKLGAVSGVLATRAGWRDGLEVVQVEFDPRIVPYEKLLRTARSLQCASVVFTAGEAQHARAAAIVGEDARPATGPFRDAKAADQAYYLGRTHFRHLPLTRLQSTRLNAALSSGGDPAHWLSPRQQQLAERAADNAAEESRPSPRGIRP